MKKILFSHSYFYKFDSKQWKTCEPYPPLMTITAAALMRQNDYEVQLFDFFGKLIQNDTYYESQVSLNLSNLSSGGYFLKILMEGETYVKRIIIK